MENFFVFCNNFAPCYWYSKRLYWCRIFLFGIRIFLYKTCTIKKRTTFEYTKNRIKTVYFDYIIAFIFLAILGNIFKFTQFKSIWHIFSEILMLQNIGIPFATGGINYPTWYLSVLITASPIIYFCLKKFNKKIYNIFSTITILTIFATLIAVCGRLEYWQNIGYVFYAPWLRGFADILLGTIIAQISEKFVLKSRLFVIVFEIITIIGITMLTFNSILVLDFLAPILFSILLFLSASELSLSHKIGSIKLLNNAEKVSFIFYLNQALAIYLTNYIFQNYSNYFILTIFLLAIFILLYFISFLIKKFIVIIINKIKQIFYIT